MPAKPLGRERKRLAFFVIAIGLGTFFLPMVILNPPLLNGAQWSPYRIASAVNAGALPVPKEHFDEALLEIALLYLLHDTGSRGCLLSERAEATDCNQRGRFYSECDGEI